MLRARRRQSRPEVSADDPDRSATSPSSSERIRLCKRAISEPAIFAVDPVSCLHGLVHAAADPPESRVTSRSVRSQSPPHRAPKQWLTSELAGRRVDLACQHRLSSSLEHSRHGLEYRAHPGGNRPRLTRIGQRFYGATRRGAQRPWIAQPRLEGLNVLRLAPFSLPRPANSYGQARLASRIGLTPLIGDSSDGL